MLALERPLGVVAELALFGDHVDPRRVYYIPTKPRLARDGASAELSFVKFRNRDASTGGAGLLSFTTEVAATEEQLAQVKRHVERQGVTEPLLVQVPWTGGKAVFAAALQEGDGFVEKLLGEVTPDLAATNRAMFSLLLTDEGARLVEGLVSMDGPTPLGVRYELEYAGLRPALDVRIRADYKRIYKELSWGFQFGVAYEGIGVRASVESATQKLVEAGAIQIEVLHFTDSAALQAKVDETVKWLQERILNDFFKSALQPPAHENLLQRAIDAARQIGSSLADAVKDDSMAAQLARELGVSPDALKRLGSQAAGGQTGGAAGASAGQSTFALKLQFTFRDIKQEELRTIEIDWTEARPERRTAAPQGLLSHFGVRPEVVEVEDAGTFWDSLKVNVRPLGDFTELGVRRLVVQLAYPDEAAPTTQTAFTFEPGQSAPKLFSAWTNGQGPRFRARHEVHFDEHGPWPGPPVFTGDWRTEQSLELAVHPLSGVPRVEVEVMQGTLSFAETSQVQVDFRIDGHIVSTHMLNAATPSTTFRRRLEASPVPPVGAAGAADGVEAGPPVPLLEARNTWFLAGGQRVEGRWETVEGTTFMVHGPWRSTRAIRLLPLLPDDFLEALVTLTLADGARTATVEERFEAGDRKVKVISIPSLSELPPPVTIDTVVIRGDGSTFMAPPVKTSDPVAVIRDREGTFKQVGVRLLAGPSLAAQGVMAVQVQLLDQAGGAAVDSVVFTETQRAAGQMLVPAGAGAPPARYQVTRYALDGKATSGPIADITSAEILVPAVVHA